MRIGILCRLNSLWRPIHLKKIKLDESDFQPEKKNSIIIFPGNRGSKNPVWNRLKIQFVKIGFSNLIFQKSSTDG